VDTRHRVLGAPLQINPFARSPHRRERGPDCCAGPMFAVPGRGVKGGAGRSATRTRASGRRWARALITKHRIEWCASTPGHGVGPV